MILFALFIFWLMCLSNSRFESIITPMSFCSSIPPNSWAVLSIFRLYAYSCCIFPLRALNYLGRTLITIYLTKMLNNLSRSVVYAGHVDYRVVIVLKTFVSSANIYTFEAIFSGRSFMYKNK